MSGEDTKSTAVEAMKRALAAKKAKGGSQPGPVGGPDAKSAEKAMTRQAAALNKPAFRRASKRG